MFSSGRSVSKPLVAALVRFSSKTKKYDPRTPEFRKRVTPWDTPEKEEFSFFKLFHPNVTSTDVLKYLTSPVELSKSSVGAWWKKQIRLRNLSVQAYDPIRQANLGTDLSLGHAILPLGAALHYKGKPWIRGLYGPLQTVSLPDTFQEGWVLEAVDISNCNIYFEGFFNFQNLTSLHTIKAQNCPYLDDWCLDRICSEVLGLEHLDLSGCKSISPRGLAPLTRLPNLHTLDLSNCPAFETPEGKLVCLLLQDYMKNLDIKGVELTAVPVHSEDKVPELAV